RRAHLHLHHATAYLMLRVNLHLFELQLAGITANTIHAKPHTKHAVRARPPEIARDRLALGGFRRDRQTRRIERRLEGAVAVLAPYAISHALDLQFSLGAVRFQ